MLPTCFPQLPIPTPLHTYHCIMYVYVYACICACMCISQRCGVANQQKNVIHIKKILHIISVPNTNPNTSHQIRSKAHTNTGSEFLKKHNMRTSLYNVYIHICVCMYAYVHVYMCISQRCDVATGRKLIFTLIIYIYHSVPSNTNPNTSHQITSKTHTKTGSEFLKKHTINAKQNQIKTAKSKHYMWPSPMKPVLRGSCWSALGAEIAAGGSGGLGGSIWVKSKQERLAC